jgi:very-short-patch-repair endonuclease
MKKHPAAGAHSRARILRRNMTEAERRIWGILRAEQIQGHKFRRQVPIGRYIADFVSHEARLIIEIDGGQHDPSSLQEIERSAFLRAEGYRVLRFWNNEMLANLDGVHAVITAELNGIVLGGNTPSASMAGSGPATPSPSMGEGRGGGVSPATRPTAKERAHITPTQTLPHQGGGLIRSGARR